MLRGRGRGERETYENLKAMFCDFLYLDNQPLVVSRHANPFKAKIVVTFYTSNITKTSERREGTVV